MSLLNGNGAPAQQQIPVQPVPTKATVGQGVGADGRRQIVVQFATPQGVNVFFFTPDVARSLGAEMRRLGQAGELLIPPTGGESL